MGRSADILELSHRLPTRDEVDSAADAATALANAKNHNGALEIIGSDGNPVRFAPAIAALLVDLLGHIARGNMVTMVPTGAMLTTQQAAEILNVSRPYVSQLLKDGVIPYVPIGSHRRVRFDDLMHYKQQRDGVRQTALDELARLGQEFDAS